MKRRRSEESDERPRGASTRQVESQQPSSQPEQEGADSRLLPPPPPSADFRFVRRQHSTRQRAAQQQQLQEEERRRQEAEQQQQKRAQKRQSRLAIEKSLSAEPAKPAPGSRRACRQLSKSETARVLIIGGGPAGLSAAWRLVQQGYSEVQILEARDRLGGRVNTLHLDQLVDSAIQQRRRQIGQQQAQDDAELRRLQRLRLRPNLGLVDEGAAFIHGYKAANPMYEIFPSKEVKEKSEGNEQWWEDGRTLRPELVDTARDIYELISDRVLNRVEREETQRGRGSRGELTPAALSDDRSVAECFTTELNGFWQRRQRLRDGGEDSDTELRLWRTTRSLTREQQGDSASVSSESSSFSFPSSTSSISLSQDLCNSQTSTVAFASSASAMSSAGSSSSSSSSRSREDQLKRVLAALSTSQHCYVAAGGELSARDLLHCANEPPLVTPEMVPDKGYSWLTDWLVAHLGSAPTFRLGCQVTRVEERPQEGQPREERKAEQREEDREGGSESCYVEVTARQAENGREERLIADYVIVTAPIGVLLQDSIAFWPSLSTVHPLSAPSVSRDECIRQLRMGRESKVILCWSEPWWGEQMQYFRSPAHPCIKIINLAALETSKYTLVIHFAPPLAAKVEGMPTAEAAAFAVGILRSMFGRHVPDCDFCHVTRWGVDQWSMGSYSFVPVGSSSSYSNWLADLSFESRVLFAGEHCAGGDMQTVHGAYRSGDQAARRVKLLVEQHGLREAEHRQVRQTAEQALRDDRNRQAKQDTARPPVPSSHHCPCSSRAGGEGVQNGRRPEGRRAPAASQAGGEAGGGGGRAASVCPHAAAAFCPTIVGSSCCRRLRTSTASPGSDWWIRCCSWCSAAVIPGCSLLTDAATTAAACPTRSACLLCRAAEELAQRHARSAAACSCSSPLVPGRLIRALLLPSQLVDREDGRR